MSSDARLAVWFAALLLVAPASAGDWISDNRMRCRVWNPNPTAQESASWSGSCEDGFAQGEGVVQWFRNGLPLERNEGSWMRGRQVGHGVQVWTTGRYEGDVRDGMPHGHGVLVLGDARYEGEFSDGKPNGAGILRNPKGVFEGIWKSGCFRSGNRIASIGVEVSSCR
jgi:hypothetical protein